MISYACFYHGHIVASAAFVSFPALCNVCLFEKIGMVLVFCVLSVVPHILDSVTQLVLGFHLPDDFGVNMEVDGLSGLERAGSGLADFDLGVSPGIDHLAGIA